MAAIHVMTVASLIKSGTPIFEAVTSTEVERLFLLFGQAILFAVSEKYNKEQFVIG